VIALFIDTPPDGVVAGGDGEQDTTHGSANGGREIDIPGGSCSAVALAGQRQEALATPNPWTFCNALVDTLPEFDHPHKIKSMSTTQEIVRGITI